MSTNDVWGPNGLPPKQYPCTVCGTDLPPGVRATMCWECLADAIKYRAGDPR